MKAYGGKNRVERYFSHRGKSQGVKNAYRRFKKKARRIAEFTIRKAKEVKE